MRLVIVEFFLVVVVGSAVLPACNSISEEGAALLAFKDAIYDDPNSVLSNWNPLDQHPCNWSGVFCQANAASVQALNLPGSSLKGFIAPELGQLASLQILNLRRNNILGAIPRELGGLKNLENLDLGLNQLTGAIPNEIGNLSSIAKIYLEGNDLAGNIPPELGNLEKLQELRLNRNRLQGTIPSENNSTSKAQLQGLYIAQGRNFGICNSKQLKLANFSHNFLVGKIPSCLKYLPSSSFEWNCFQDSKASTHQRPPEQCGFNAARRKHAPKHLKSVNQQHAASRRTRALRPSWLLIFEIVMGTFVAGFFVMAAVITILKYKTNAASIRPWKRTSSGQVTDVEGLKDVPVISRAELEAACEDFSNIIGSFPDSMVYKGTASDGTEIAVSSMRISVGHWTSHSELYFQRKVADLARLNHKNIVKLLGYCAENEPFTRMVMFEYASNGTLYEHLHYGEAGQLGWTTRMKIIVGVAYGLQYMHHELVPPIAMLDLDSSAVYLTEDFFPKLTDFEIWKAVFAKNEGMSGLKGSTTVGGDYVESSDRNPSAMEGNIFSFGVLLLEIITGRFPYSKEQGSLVDWAQQYLEHPEVTSYLVDPSLGYFRYVELQTVCEVVRLCIQTDRSRRPSMKQIVTVLEAGIDTSFEAAGLKESPLMWAELALLS